MMQTMPVLFDILVLQIVPKPRAKLCFPVSSFLRQLFSEDGNLPRWSGEDRLVLPMGHILPLTVLQS